MYYLIRLFSSPDENLKILLKNTNILILPFSNVNGYASVRRTEEINGIFLDPNRDFPYNQREKKCL